MTGRKHSEESKLKMSISRTGKKKIPLSEESKNNIAKSKMKFKLITPIGEFNTYQDLSNKVNLSKVTIANIFRCLDNVPRDKSLEPFDLKNPNKISYRELGFYKLSL